MPPNPQPIPDNLLPGAVDQGDGRVTFALYAPRKQAVHLIGDFNGWDHAADLMHATEGGLWWIEKQFPPGRHTYQFDVDGVTICDPYATALAEDADKDPPRAIVEVGAKPYEWQHDDWTRPAFRDLIIYELAIGDFTPEGTFKGMTDRLDHLVDLGVNAIELMPVFEFPGRATWGYNPVYLFTVEKSYGSPHDLRRLIDAAHGRGIAVILDIVFAHSGHTHPFNRLYPYEESPWYGQGLGEPNQFGFPTFDYSKGPAQSFARDVQAYWIREFHIDGFRYDYLHGVGFKEGMGLPFLIQAAREARPDVYLIGEYSPEDAGAVDASGLNGAWHVSVSYAIKALLTQGEFDGFHWDDFDRCVSAFDPHRQGYNRADQLVNYLESHDEPRVIYVCRAAGQDENTARFKSGLGAAVLFTLPGEPMLYHGQEWGEATERTLERNLLHWDLLQTEGGRGLFQHFQRLCRLRRDHPAVRAEGYAVDALYPEQKSLVFHRWEDVGDEVVVVVNFSSASQSIKAPFPHAGRWREILSDRTIDVEQEHTVELGPSAASIFVRD
jgi:1,4-alpha-glucan branching enzyme